MPPPTASQGAYSGPGDTVPSQGDPGEIVAPGPDQPQGAGSPYAPTGDPLVDGLIYVAAGGGVLGAAARFLPGMLAKMQLEAAWRKHQKAVKRAQKRGENPPVWTPPTPPAA